jgi:hypothetical protein
MKPETLSANNKALRLNLDRSNYGTLAEIGGGQETARLFFKAGGASGTIAKTISAYDKAFSNEIYNQGKPGRYVSESRVDKMLHQEYKELVTLLGDDTQRRFFAFANSVETLNFTKNNRPHGWLGMRFQLQPQSEPNHIMIHVKLLENDATLQQITLGILGINLVYASYYYHDRPNVFLSSLLDNLNNDQVQITMVRMSGPQLAYVDNRLLGVQLVKNGMTHAIMFDRYGNVQEPDDMLYKKNVLAFRGRFRPVTYVTLDIIRSSIKLFKKDKDYEPSNTITLCEITLNNLMERGSFDEKDFLDRVDQLNLIGQNVMISDFKEFYKLTEYFSQFRLQNIRIVIGVKTFLKVLDPNYYTHLNGGILEAFGKLFPGYMKMYLYPALANNNHDQVTSGTLDIPENLFDLYKYLLNNRKIIDIQPVNPNFLNIDSRKVINLIEQGKKEWEHMVPKYVINMIKKRRMFGFRGTQEE